MKQPDRMTRDRLLDALRHLGARLDERGIQGQIYVVGGAAMAFAYHSDRMTRDIDGIVAPEDAVFSAARELTEELKLPEEWINDTARAFLPEVAVDQGPIVLDVPGLVVRTAPAEVVLAMKILSARPEQDAPDIRFLADLLGLTRRDEVRDVFLRYYPHGHLLDRSEMLLGDLFPDP